MSLTFSDYQSRANTTARYPGQGEFMGLTYAVLGLNGEAGECAERVKKTWRDDGELTERNRELLVKEIGDTLWYTAALATELGVDLGDVAQANIVKCTDREARGVIGGEGDER